MKPLSFLLIEDDEIERMKFKRIFSKLGYQHSIIEALNGEEAIEIIDSGKIPDIILLDLNMPKMNGLDFLRHFKKEEQLRYIPIVVLTTSNNHLEIKNCYKEGASGYIIKPLAYEDYVVRITGLVNYWEQNEIIKI